MYKRLSLTIFLLSISLVLFAFYISTAQQEHSESVTPPELATCSDTEIQKALDTLPTYQPTETRAFVTHSNGLFTVDGDVYYAKGVNYYPSRYPWRRFLTESDLATIEQELSLLRDANLNTLRIFLWNEALFTCPGSGAVPIADNFVRLDGIIQLAADHGFRLIVTLNDLADLEDYPLYDNPAYVQAQTRFIVERYRDEAAIMA